MWPLRNLVAVVCGGVVGATVRLGVNELFGGVDDLLGEPAGGAPFPWATLIVNVLGSGLLGFVLFGRSREPTRAALGTGFCGGLTTFSTFAVEIAEHLQDGQPLTALSYMLVSVALGLGAFLIARQLVIGGQS